MSTGKLACLAVFGAICMVSQAWTPKPVLADEAIVWNGSHWKEWDKVRKAYYIWGLEDGLTGATYTILVADQGLSTDSEEFRHASRGLLVRATPKQIVRGIDEVYEDYRNEGLSVRDVALYVHGAIAGMYDTSELQRMREKASSVK